MTIDIRKQTHVADMVFKIKSSLLQTRRYLHNTVIGVRKFSTTARQLTNAPIVSFSVTPLWNSSDTEQNEILTVGKVQNLRVAANVIHGIEVPANTVFSFWKQIGCPHRGKGYVFGREIREGCLVPTIGGGMCQLSNALYDGALQAGFTIVERHRHSQIISGSLAEQDRDATVKWNYVDLRFTSTHAFRIEVELTSEHLVVRFKSDHPSHPTIGGDRPQVFQPVKLNDCYSCGNLECLKNPGSITKYITTNVTTYLLDEDWPEYNAYIAERLTENDIVIVSSRNHSLKNIQHHTKKEENRNSIIRLSFSAWIQSLRLRLALLSGNNVFSAKLHLDEAAAIAAAKRILWNSTHLIVSQNLLPFLWKNGILNGRTFDVMMTRLPFETLHKRLDIAYTKHHQSKTLRDFRVSRRLIDLENSALNNARYIVTPHQDIAAIFENKTILLQWSTPEDTPLPAPHGKKVLFPASTLGRKGAYEMRSLARELSLSLVIQGQLLEDPTFWDDVSTTIATRDPLTGIGLVVYPTYVEHQPRKILRALAAGIRVITTMACGLSPTENLIIVPVGDYDALRAAVESELTRMFAI